MPPLTTRHGELHVLRDVPGAAPYPALRARALVTELGEGVPVAIVSVDDLIAMKQATARPGDIEDIAALNEVARRTHEGAGTHEGERGAADGG